MLRNRRRHRRLLHRRQPGTGPHEVQVQPLDQPHLLGSQTQLGALGAELEELLAGALSGRSLDSLDIDSESPMRRSPRFVSNVAGRT